MKQQPLNDHIRITVKKKSLPLFTTLLQSGIELNSTTDTSIGIFLSRLQPFPPDYIAETVQTIFLNGTAVDDLSLKLTGDRPVLALSGAMPGLAGAIFRKNSFHAALRTDTRATGRDTAGAQANTVVLKLFNRIARERGPELLAQGVAMKSRSLRDFLARRPALLQDICSIRLGASDLSIENLFDILDKNETIPIVITRDNERDN